MDRFFFSLRFENIPPPPNTQKKEKRQPKLTQKSSMDLNEALAAELNGRNVERTWGWGEELRREAWRKSPPGL